MDFLDGPKSSCSKDMLRPYQFHIFVTCMLHENSLLKEITETLMTNKFPNEIKVLNNPSKERNKADLSQVKVEHIFI